jgi:hypothetical protein
MSFWDNPSFRDTEGDRFTWEQPGDKLEGRVVALESFKGMQGEAPLIKLADCSWRKGTSEGQARTMEFIAGAKQLKRQLLEKKPDVGARLTVELIELKPQAAGTAKLYYVGVAPSLPVQPQATAAPVSVPDDFFS